MVESGKSDCIATVTRVRKLLCAEKYFPTRVEFIAYYSILMGRVNFLNLKILARAFLRFNQLGKFFQCAFPIRFHRGDLVRVGETFVLKLNPTF